MKTTRRFKDMLGDDIQLGAHRGHPRYALLSVQDTGRWGDVALDPDRLRELGQAMLDLADELDPPAPASSDRHAVGGS